MSSDSACAQRQGALPERWPSAWPSLRSQVLLDASGRLVAALMVIIVLEMTQTLAIAWWVAAIPLALLGWALSLPVRVRSVMQRAHRAHTLEVVHGPLGLIAEVRRRRLGVRPQAEVAPGRSVRYHLNSGRRSQRRR